MARADIPAAADAVVVAGLQSGRQQDQLLVIRSLKGDLAAGSKVPVTHPL